MDIENDCRENQKIVFTAAQEKFQRLSLLLHDVSTFLVVVNTLESGYTSHFCNITIRTIVIPSFSKFRASIDQISKYGILQTLQI